MYSESDIIAKAWLVKEVINYVLQNQKLRPEVDKIFVVGSYACGKQTPMSDLDFLVQLKNDHKVIKYTAPDWKILREIHSKLNDVRLHIFFGTEEAAKSLHEKHRNEIKDYSYREITFQGGAHAVTHSSNLSRN